MLILAAVNIRYSIDTGIVGIDKHIVGLVSLSMPKKQNDDIVVAACWYWQMGGKLLWYTYW